MLAELFDHIGSKSTGLCEGIFSEYNKDFIGKIIFINKVCINILM